MYEKLKTKDVAFRVKVRVGDNFWTSTPFVHPQKQKKGIMCDFKETYCIRVDRDKVDKAIVSLWVCPIEGEQLPDEFQSLKTELTFGYTIIRLDKEIAEQKKVYWIPLNNGVCFEDLTMKKDDAMLSMNFSLMEKMPGNYPEAAMSGKNFTIGEMVYYNEMIELKYPGTQSEFDLLERKDINFEPERVGKVGCPLRYPMNEDEWKLANIECIYIP